METTVTNSISETKTKRKRKRFAPDRKYVLQIMRAKGVSEQRAWAMFRLSVELSTYNFNQMQTS